MEEIKKQTRGQDVTGTAAEAVAGAPGNETQPTAADAGCDRSRRRRGVTRFIEIDDFAKVELRVGEVRTAERIPKADKLLLITYDIGEEKPRQILAGIAQYYEPRN